MKLPRKPLVSKVAQDVAQEMSPHKDRANLDPATILMLISIITKVILFFINRYHTKIVASRALNPDNMSIINKLALRYMLIRQFGLKKGNKVYVSLVKVVKRLDPTERYYLVSEVANTYMGEK